MKDTNRVVMVGRLGKDIELRKTTTGKVVTQFALAVNGRGEGNTYWIDCVAWEKLAELFNSYVHKGDRVLIEGSITSRNFERKDGTKGKTTEIIVSDVQFLETKRSQEASNNEYSNFNTGNPIDISNEDLPF